MYKNKRKMVMKSATNNKNKSTKKRTKGAKNTKSSYKKMVSARRSGY